MVNGVEVTAAVPDTVTTFPDTCPWPKSSAQAGYEDHGLFGPGIGWFAPETETVAVKAVRKLAKQAGRQSPNNK